MPGIRLMACVSAGRGLPSAVCRRSEVGRLIRDSCFLNLQRSTRYFKYVSVDDGGGDDDDDDGGGGGPRQGALRQSVARESIVKL